MSDRADIQVVPRYEYRTSLDSVRVSRRIKSYATRQAAPRLLWPAAGFATHLGRARSPGSHESPIS